MKSFAIRKELQDKYIEQYAIAKITKHIPSFIEYIEYKDEKEARQKLAEEKDEPPSLFESLSTTFKSYLGVKKTNILYAKKALRVLFKAVDDCKPDSKCYEVEPVIVTGALIELSAIYKTLYEKRSPYSPAHVFCKDPTVLTKIKNIFDEYKIVPNVEILSDEERLPNLKLKVFKAFH